MYIVSFNSYVHYSSIKIIFIIIFSNISYLTQTFIAIKTAIDNVINDTRRYKLIILYIKQGIIDLNTFMQKINVYQLI